MLSGVLCWYYQSKPFALGTIFFFFTSVLNFKFEYQLQQAMTSFTLLALAISQAYLVPV